MNKKIFTLLLLAVFVLAQFSLASADALAGVTATIDPLPTFSAANNTLTIDYHLILPGDLQQNVLLWTRYAGNAWSEVAGQCKDLTGNVNGLLEVVGTYDYVLGAGSNLAPGDQDVIEFYITVNDNDAPGNGCVAGNAANLNADFADPNLGLEPLASTFIDNEDLDGLWQAPPSLTDDGWNFVACNTFEYFALVSDSYPVNAGEGYSGFGAWNTGMAGVFAPPAPEGADNAFLSWVVTLPPTASGNWTFSMDPTDMAGNSWGTTYFRNAKPIVAGETDDCMDFTDVAGHADEVYIRYLATLGLIAGNPDGSFGPDSSLTRAEAAVLFEKANGWSELDPATLPTAAPSAACTFSDVSASDWFSGWVWQACADGFMNGIGGGLFDPSNKLTRGQVVTIFHNIDTMGGGTDGYLDYGSPTTLLSSEYGDYTPYLREAAWTDVLIGAYYTIPVMEAYGVGIADGTSATTFSPDQPATRGDFAKMLYRAISDY